MGRRCAACRTRARDASLPQHLVPAAYAISGVFDVAPLMHTAMQPDLRLDATSAGAVSPLFWPAPRGTTFDAVVGGLESSEFLRQSRAIAEQWGKAGVATAIHYPTPIHLQRAYAHLGQGPGSCPVAERAVKEMISLPMFPDMTVEQVDRTCDVLLASL